MSAADELPGSVLRAQWAVEKFTAGTPRTPKFRPPTTAAISQTTLTAGLANAGLVVAARARRIVFGASLVAGAAALVLRSLIADVGAAMPLPAAWEIVVVTWLVALAASVLAGPLACSLPFGEPRVSTDDDSLVASLTLPAAGLALFVPVTLHMPLALLFGGEIAFDAWSTRSMALVGHAHVVLAVLCAHRAATGIDRLSIRDGQRPDDTAGGAAEGAADGDVARTPAAIYVITILVSTVPFGLVDLVPPLLVAMTGLPILALLPHAERIVERERALLAGAP